ncbi:hypothetical protein ACJMK2_010995 [Sinanodonta woodiana]|uniref:Uncharacterized protein n=1 Tax=Sinanodonta woodiana TaxID=1069815 RepID=A0ABD3V654_SINWO
MAANVLPPRLKKTDSLKLDKSKSSLEILMQMGFTKQRSEKAIAATGDRGVQLASDWLLSHVNDPNLDSNEPRQYMLYLCPVGPLQKQLTVFFEKSLTICGWNGAHSYFPHITLTPFFTVEDSKVSVLKHALNKAESVLKQAPGSLQLDFFSQNNFIGLFVPDTYFRYLSEVVSQFSAELKKAGISMETHKKQLHITLAYQYAASQNDTLNKLAKEIDLGAPCQWDLRIYSRDPRFAKHEVRKVIKAYKPGLIDELELIDGDFILVDPQEYAQSKDQWYQGTSWLTGTSGMFPGPYTVRTAETWTWTLHGSLPLTDANAAIAVEANGHDLYDNLWRDHRDGLYAKVVKKNSGPEKKKEPRKLYVMRHGERIDFIFGRDWCEKCFDASGNYKRIDLNMPKTILKRNNFLDNVKDAPLTTIGQMQTLITGEFLQENGTVINHVYVSPAFRCVQTATGILKGLGVSLPLHIEPGLFEWMGWYQLGLPKWFTPQELQQHGFNVDTSYVPYISGPKLDYDETIELYYKRSGEIAKKILKKHELDGGNVLIVGHAGTLDVCTRHVLGKSPRSSSEFHDICPKVPYCGMCVCQEDMHSKKWSLQQDFVPPLTHGQNKLNTSGIIQLLKS